MTTDKNLSCNFCGKSRHEIEKLIVVDDSSICDECVDLCFSILEEDRFAKLKNKILDNSLLNPIRIREHLDEFVVSQERSKMVLAVAVANHFKRINYPPKDLELEKSNIMIAGPTGNGKTMLARAIAKYLDVPFVIADATTLTESGYVGDDVESIVSRLFHVSDYNVKKCEHGIIFIDEIDKIARKGENASITRDVSGEGVQQALLKLVEGTICNISPEGGRKHPEQQTVKINTKDILFIGSGAFVGLDEIVEKRSQPSGIGFGADIPLDAETVDKTKFLADVEPHDFVTFGLIPEFTGRFPVFTYVDKLTVDDLVHILADTKNNLIAQFQYFFTLQGIDLEFTKSALKAIAEKAVKLETGARGLRSIIEEVLLPHQYELYNYAANKVKKMVVNHDTIGYNSKVKFIYEKEVNETVK